MILDHQLTVPDGSAEGLTIPYLEVRGDSDSGTGPRLTVIAGIHGGEYTSVAAAREFATTLTPDQVRGRIVVAPLVNVPSYFARSAFVVPDDGKNINRCFPGRADGTLAERIAHHVYQTLILDSDFVVDMHAGDIPESLEPFTIYDESPVAAAARDMARAYGFGHCVRQATDVRTVAGSTCAAAADAGIPAIIAESGGNGLLVRSDVDRHLAGLRNMARSIGVLTGEVDPVAEVAEYDGWHWLRTSHAGWWEPAVPVGARVRAGDLLGTVSDVWSGHTLARITAPEAGSVLFLTASPAVTADGLLLGLARPADR